MLNGMLIKADAGKFNSDKFEANAETNDIIKDLKTNGPKNADATKPAKLKAPTTKAEYLTILKPGNHPQLLKSALKKYNKWAGSHADTEVEAAITTLFGVDADGTASKYLELVEKIDYTETAKESSETVKLFAMDEATLLNATNAAKAANLKAEAAAKPCTAAIAPKDAEELCNGKKCHNMQQHNRMHL
ncbi:uncharacterized protein TEOVI_000519100 [Trypanosoma equiperdum]|uniref:Trypanosome variant surface glycoprotein (A-type) n=1 Tax=Trypanosoma equiperdum TaxID=5694 RepID=A0A1G4IKL6_TRYEQ|nr:hypothetical protein, conserved [Trypanosoma equiperdum]